ncbi:hypothetical protein FOMPIDRAFT_1015319 [Fomitopsis schrenkii]|uniref:Uncharacterized protein n=1 Tax=Fomitopsis schrenkii TaxID=2126942 RepID=S8ED74_FOMSC|nr:hypothetical protein FOMPIDRAFT_1015319 [Fomitopsis schrenkii]
MLGLMNFAGPPPDNAPAAVTAGEDEGSQLPIALDISSSDSAEENVNEGYAGADGENGDVGADGEPEGAKEHASGTAKPSRKDKGKGRATVVEDDDDAPAGFWSTKGSFVPKLDDVESISPEDLEDMRLKLLEERTQRAVHDEPAAAPPAQDGPAHDFDFDLRKVKGCSGVEMLRIAQANAMRAEKIRAIRYKREQLQRDTSFLIEEARCTKILKWVLHSKRLALERMMNMQMSIIRYRSNSVDGGNGGNDGGDDSGAGGSGASGGSSNDGADNGEEDRVVEHDTGENSQEDDERHENQGVSDKENGGVHEDREAPSTSKAAGKQVAPPVAAGQQAAQGMMRPLQRRPSISEAGPSTSQTAPTAPTLLPAWDADAPQSAKSGLDSSSDSDSSPSPVIPSTYPRSRSPFTPPPRTSVPMRRNMQSARRPLPELVLSPVARPPSVSPPRRVEAFPLAVLSRVGTARRVSLAGAFALDSHNEHLLFGGGLSSSQESISQCMPRARPQPAEGGAGRLRGVPVPERQRGKPANQARRNGAAEEELEWRDSGDDDHGAPDEEEPEPFYEYSGPYESAFAGYRGLRGTNIRAPSPS